MFPRTAKSVPLSDEMRRALDVDAEALPPDELIRAILRAPVDLLWNGGVGTYVKASTEANTDVGDKNNDAVRIDATELRCRVVGEGGNLGLTQRGRIEFARGGGHINTDAIDNAAGVNCSDNEVNIKILLDRVVRDGDLTGKQRDALLAAMTDDVAAQVLSDNDGQTRALSIAAAQAAAMCDVHVRYLDALERAGRLDRALEQLPTGDELRDRAQTGGGLTMPEFAVVLAYSKIALFGELLASDVPEDPFLGRELEQYFPEVLRSRYADQIREHPLRREIIATRVTNSVVDRAGTTFVFRLTEETGMAAPDVARAHTAAREIFGLRALWAQIAALDDILGTDTQITLLLEVRRLAERATRWLLRNRTQPLDIAATTEFFQPGVRELALLVPKLVTETGGGCSSAPSTATSATVCPKDLAWSVGDVARPHLGPGHHDGRPLHPAPGRGGGRGLLRTRRVPETRLAAGPDTRPAARRPVAEPRPGRPPRGPARRPFGHHGRGPADQPARRARATSRCTAGSRRSKRRRTAACACSATSSTAAGSTSPRFGRAPRDPEPGAGQHPGDG